MFTTFPSHQSCLHVADSTPIICSPPISPTHDIEISIPSNAAPQLEHCPHELHRILYEFSQVFSTNKYNVPKLNIPPVKINTTTDKIIALRPYRVPLHDQQEIQTQIEQMLQYGIIAPSVSPYASPITLVTKRDQTKRFCIDYRKLNEIIAPDVHPLPLIETILDKLSKAKYYSSVDIASAYWQVEIEPNSRAVNVYNKFIADYARLRAPLNKLLKKDVKWNWNTDCQQAFTTLKESLTSKPVLHLYQVGLSCRLYCDASTQGIAGILKQVHPDGQIHPVQYFSRALRAHERNYTVSELECLAIVESVDKFRIYLTGIKFTIYTDHQALQWLKTIKNPSGRLFRWSLRLSTYNYEIHYIKGSQQYEADLLSRNPFVGFISTDIIKQHQPTASPFNIDTNGLHTITRKGVTKIIIPETLQHTLMNKVHQEYNHPGISQMTRIITTQYYWKGISKSIEKFVRSCHTCQIIKRPKGKPYGALGQIPPPQQPFDLISIDTIAGFSKYGHSKTYLHVIVDHLTRYAWTFPSKSTSTLTYIQTLKTVLQQGSPKRLLSDRAPAFTSEKFRKFLIMHGIQPLLTTSNNPQANGLIERLNATITGKLRLAYLENPKASWTQLVKRVTQTYNNTPHSVTSFPPTYLMFNVIPPDLRTHLNPYPEIKIAREIANSRTQNKHKKDKETFDKQHRTPHFEENDLVLVKNYRHPDTGESAYAVPTTKNYTPQLSQFGKVARVNPTAVQWLSLSWGHGFVEPRDTDARLRKYGLQVRPSKCQLFQDEVTFLGHRVDKDGIHPKENNIEIIKDMSPPKTVSGVRRFLGAVGFYRKFIAGFSEIAAPLYELTKKGTSSAPILIHPDYRKKFVILTDASDMGCGGMLSQLKNGTPLPITFYSHKFRGAELNYSTIEKECLAIIMAIEQFDYYIYGQQVEIYCDHKPLQYLKSLENKNRRLMKWALMLQDKELTFFPFDVYEGVTAIPNYDKSMLNCPVWETIYKKVLSTDSEVEESDGTYFISKSTRYLVKVSPDSRPTRKGRMVKQIVIPPVLRDTILERYVKTCPVCAENNGKLKKAPNMPIQPANYPFERLCVDFVGPVTLSRNRNRYLLVFIDAFTRYAEVIPVRDCTAKTAAFEFVNKIVNRYGTCKEILSVRGAAFESDLFREICKLYSIKKLSTTSYRPTCNSIVERVNGTICSILRHYANSRNWEDNLGAAVSAYNNAVHSALGESPHYMLFGYDAVNHEVSDKDVSEFRKPSLAERLKEMQDARETDRKFLSENYDERVKKYKAQTGKGSSKFSEKFYGPFRVVAKVSEVNFRVRGVNMHDEQVVHIDRMKAFRSMHNRKPAAAKRECYPRGRIIPLTREGGSACRISPRREMSPPPLENTTVLDQENGDSHDEPTVVDGGFDRAHFSPYFLRPNPRPANPR
ncbi:hypothetical protein LAZ67_16002677 [Cordylochernes scorpioides]|uniref:RNA-directed DNA polymerase n=1 Tax=Cordylochernes scorpioides TaxID=51811 RepID=A0ABY6LC60_9ARAC|nr:hypothetical protein LAZ67_16002677 [Cordylochernes scorpioides]